MYKIMSMGNGLRCYFDLGTHRAVSARDIIAGWYSKNPNKFGIRELCVEIAIKNEDKMINHEMTMGGAIITFEKADVMGINGNSSNTINCLLWTSTNVLFSPRKLTESFRTAYTLNLDTLVLTKTS